MEDDRRHAQREVQQLVVRLRGEGKTESEIHAAKRVLKQKLGSFQKPESRQAKKAKAWYEWLNTEEAQDQKKENLEHKHELVIVPVIWRGRHDSEDVLAAAQGIKACLAQQGLDVWIDSRRHYTPGQKFAHWEHRGVMLRVEIGPQDLKDGVCRLCRAKEPGEYKSVERKRVRLPPRGTRTLLLTLKDWGLSQLAVERRAGDSEEEEADGGGASGGKGGGGGGATGAAAPAAAAASAAGEDVDGNWAPRTAVDEAKTEKKKTGKSKKRRRLQEF